MHLTVLAPTARSAPFVAAVARRHLAGGGTAEVVVGTADDLTVLDLRVCATADAVVDALAGREPTAGRTVAKGLARLGAARWPELSDEDVATHLARSAWLARGVPAAEVLARIAEARGVDVVVRPVTEVPVETHVVLDVPDGDAPQSAVHVRQWREERAGSPAPQRVVVAGLDGATAAPGVLDGIRASDAVVVPAADPVLDVGAMLGVPGVRDALRGTSATVVVVDPTAGEGDVPGLAVAGLPGTGPGAATVYRDLADVWVTSAATRTSDGDRYPAGMRVVTSTRHEDPAGLAEDVLAALG